MNLFDLKPELLAIYQNLIDETELLPGQAEALGQARDRLQDEQFSLVVAGRFSVGKSLLINRAFLGADILPSRNEPTNCHPVYIVYGPENRLTLRDVEGGLETVVGDEKIAQALEEFGSQSQGRRPDRYQHFELAWNDPKMLQMLQRGVVLVDTIGTEDTEEHYIQKTYAEMEKASAVLFLFNMQQVGTDSELKFLDRYLSGARKKLFIVLTRADTRDEDEQREIREDFAQRIQPFFAARQIRVEDRVFVVSAKTRQGLDRLRQALIDFIANDRFKELFREHAGGLHQRVRTVREQLDREFRDLLARQAGDNQVLREQQQQIERLEEDLKHRGTEIKSLQDEVIESAIDEARGELGKLLDDTLDKVRMAADKEALKYALERLPNDLRRVFDRTGRQVQSGIREGLRERIKSWSGRPDFDSERLFEELGGWRFEDFSVFGAKLAEALGVAGSIWGILGGVAVFIESLNKTAQTGKVVLWWQSLAGGAAAPAIAPALTAAAPWVLGGLATMALGHQFAKWMSKKSLQACKDEVSKSLRKAINQLEDTFREAITDYTEQQLQRYLEHLERHLEQERKRLEALLREKDPAAIQRAIATSQARRERADGYLERLAALQTRAACCLTDKTFIPLQWRALVPPGAIEFSMARF